MYYNGIQARRTNTEFRSMGSRVSSDCYDMFNLLATVIGDAGEDLNIVSLRNVIK